MVCRPGPAPRRAAPPRPASPGPSPSTRGRTLQDFGFELEETRPFVECLRAGHPQGDSCPASLAVYRRKLDELDALIGELQQVRAQIGDQLARAMGVPPARTESRARERARESLAAEAMVPGGPEPVCELGGRQ
ncbi:MerR family DNA-binding protein [Streptomyces sp. NPDC004290]